jgi:PKD repeat protein
VAASNAGGNGTAVLRIQIVLPPAPQITSLLAANGTVGANFTYQISATNNATRYSATGLPAGLTLNAATGLISGNPTQRGNSTVALAASNAGGNGTAVLRIQIVLPPAPQITSLLAANGTVGANFTYQITALNNPLRYAATGLPPGLAVNAATGLISGKPTRAGNSTVSLSTSNAGGNGTASLAISIRPKP